MEENALLDSEAVLEPFVLLAKDLVRDSANVSTIRPVVMKMLADPKLFAGFDDILKVLQPRLAEAGAEAEPIIKTFELFSFGTWKEFNGSKSQCLPLTDSHVFKIRQLTLLSLVQQACSTGGSIKCDQGGCFVPYQTMAQEMGFAAETVDTTANTPLDPSVLRQVEEVALSCIYARVVAGQLCQKSAALFVSSRRGPPCRPRDVPLSNGATMLSQMKQFKGRLEQARNRQQKGQQTVQNQVDASRQFWYSVQERKKRAESNNKWGDGSGAGKNGPPSSQERRMSQPNKRSRGGVSGGGFTTAFQY